MKKLSLILTLIIPPFLSTFSQSLDTRGFQALWEKTKYLLTVCVGTSAEKHYCSKDKISGIEKIAGLYQINKERINHNQESADDISPREYLSWYLSEYVKKGTAPSQDEIGSFLPHNLITDMREWLKVNKPGQLIFPSV